MIEDLLRIINEIQERNDRPILGSLEGKISLRNDLGFDSLDLAMLTVKIEDKYAIDIFEKEPVDFTDEIIQLISGE